MARQPRQGLALKTPARVGDDASPSGSPYDAPSCSGASQAVSWWSSQRSPDYHTSTIATRLLQVAGASRLSAKSALANAFNYTIRRREALSRFLADARLEIDNNIAENAMRGGTEPRLRAQRRARRARTLTLPLRRTC